MTGPSLVCLSQGYELKIPAMSSVPGSLNIAVTVNGVSPVNDCPFVRKDLLSMVVPRVPEKLELSASRGQIGDEILIKGFGFSPSSAMKITLNGDDLKISIETDALGSFASGFHVPEISAGDYTIEAEDQYGFSATASITISPRHKRGSVRAPNGYTLAGKVRLFIGESLSGDVSRGWIERAS